MEKGRVFIFANRTNPKAVGGLTSLLNDHIDKKNQDVFIIGWSGNNVATEELRQTDKMVYEDVTYLTIDFTEWEYQNAYCGFQNGYLWPLCHRILEHARINEGGLEANLKISELFCKLAVDGGNLKGDDLVLVQDYHLFLLGAVLEKNGFHNTKAFYLHIPMFDKEVAQEAERQGLYKYEVIKEIIKQMRCYDYIGFQRPADITYFLSHAVEEKITFKIEPYKMYHVKGYNVCFNPVGIDLENFQEQAKGYPLDQEFNKIRIVQPGRYDYTKGHLVFLEGLELYLKANPEMAEQMRVLFVGGASRSDLAEYQEYHKNMRDKIDLINSMFKDTIIITELGAVPRNVLAQILGQAEEYWKNGGRQIVMSPSLMDGQNLIVHEALAASVYNIICTSIGSGCVDVVGEENVYVVQHNQNHDLGAIEIKDRLADMVAVNIHQLLTKNKIAYYRMKKIYKGSNWMPHMLTYIKEKSYLQIFDIDGTVKIVQDDLDTAYIQDEIIDYIISKQTIHQDSVIVVSKREDKRIFPLCNVQSIDEILLPILQFVPLTVVSSHGLACFGRDNRIGIHPLLKKNQELIHEIHCKVQDFKNLLPNENLRVELKLTGICLHLTEEQKQNQEIFAAFKTTFDDLVAQGDLYTAIEPNELEIRVKVTKKDGIYYFIQKGFISFQPNITFFCDNVIPQDNDVLLSDYLIKQGFQSIQVMDEDKQLNGIFKTYSNPNEFCNALSSQMQFLINMVNKE